MRFRQSFTTKLKLKVCNFTLTSLNLLRNSKSSFCKFGHFIDIVKSVQVFHIFHTPYSMKGSLEKAHKWWFCWKKISVQKSLEFSMWPSFQLLNIALYFFRWFPLHLLSWSVSTIFSNGFTCNYVNGLFAETRFPLEISQTRIDCF